MAALDSKYHIKIGNYGFLLARDARIERHIYGREEAPHFVNKFSSGNPNYRDSTFFPHFVQNNFLNGFNQEIFDDGAKFYRSSGIDTTEQQKLTLQKRFFSAGQTAASVNVLCQEAWRASAAAAFGDGSDGALTISADTTDAPIDASCSGTAGSTTLSATNASFAAGQHILIIQMRGTSAGTWQKTKIAAYTAGTITTEDALSISYNSTGANKAQVIVMKRYTNVTVDATKTWTAKAWDGSVGGVLTFLANGTVAVNGTITASGKGFLGSTQSAGDFSTAGQGEGTGGDRNTQSTAANGNGGGGAQGNSGSAKPGGGGGGNGVAGSNGGSGDSTPGTGGSTAGNAALTQMCMGGGGGGGYNDGSGGTRALGNPGGGIIFFYGKTVTMGGSASIQANGDSTAGSGGVNVSGGGGGAGGSVLIKCQTATLGTTLVTATAGTARVGVGSGASGGNGGAGRIHTDYYTSVSGTTNPTLDSTQDGTLADTPAGSSFTHLVGTSGGKIYSWDGASTYTELFDARRMTWYDSGDDADSAVGNVAATEEKRAQSFQIGTTVKIKSIQVYMRRGTAVGNITARIETNSGSLPTGTLVDTNATATVTNANVGTSNGWIEFTFSTAFNLTASTTYWLVLQSAAFGSETGAFQVRVDGSSPTYTNGNLATKSGAGAWSADATKDMLFRVNGNATAVNCAIISSLSGSNKAYFGIGDFTSTDNGDGRIISYDGTTFAINKVFTSETCVLCLYEFGTTPKMYVGTGASAKIYVSTDMTTYTVSKDINVPRNPGFVFAMVEYNNKLFAGGGYPESITNNNSQFYGFLYSYDEYSWLNVFPFEHTVIKSLEVYDTLLFIGTIKKRLYVYNTATIDKLFEFPWDVQIIDMIKWDDKLALAIVPTPGSASTGNEGIYLFDRNGLHNAFAATSRVWYSVFVFNNNLMGGNDNGEVYQTNASTYQASATLQTSYDEANLPSIDKVRRALTLIYEALPAGCSIQVEYKTDESDSSWTNLGTASTLNSTSATFNFGDGIYTKKVSFRVTLATSNNANTPTLKKIIHKYVLFPDFKYLWKMKLVCSDNIMWLDDTEPITTTTAQIVSGATTIPVVSTAGFPTAGKARAGTDVFDYTGKTATTFTGVTNITTTVASGSTVKITGADLHALLLSLKQAKQFYTFTDIDGLTYTVLFHNYQADNWSVNMDD